MAERISALRGHHAPGAAGTARAVSESGEAGVALREIPGLTLHQIAAWPDTLAPVGKTLAKAAGIPSAPTSGAVLTGEAATGIALLRIEPLKWWLLGGPAPQLKPEHGATLDLSHSRTHLRITGEHAAALLNRHLPLDLRAGSFVEGAVASSALHHVGVTLWRSQHGYELFIPRGFALSVWQVLRASAAQFGAEIASVTP